MIRPLLCTLGMHCMGLVVFPFLTEQVRNEGGRFSQDQSQYGSQDLWILRGVYRWVPTRGVVLFTSRELVKCKDSC